MIRTLLTSEVELMSVSPGKAAEVSDHVTGAQLGSDLCLRISQSRSEGQNYTV